MGKIYERSPLTPASLRTVAERRFGDADALRKTGDNARANGVYYLGGFVIELLLKASVLERYPSLGSVASPERLSRQDRVTWNLVYRSHNLAELFARLPELQTRLSEADRIEGKQRLGGLLEVCEEWTIFARYSPRTEKMRDAATFLKQVKEVKEWLK